MADLQHLGNVPNERRMPQGVRVLLEEPSEQEVALRALMIRITSCRTSACTMDDRRYEGPIGPLNRTPLIGAPSHHGADERGGPLCEDGR
jgi:hypothetical protein